MFSFKKNKKKSSQEVHDNKIQNTLEETKSDKKKSFFAKLKTGLKKTRSHFTQGLSSILSGRKTLDANLLDEIETVLLQADLGVEITETLISQITKKIGRHEVNDGDAVFSVLKEELLSILKPVVKPLNLSEKQQPTAVLMVGVNGAGKTTTIGKIAKWFQIQNKQVLLAAGDTFRAAAIEQLQAWGQRNQVSVIAQKKGSDSASVIFDALQSAQARNMDLLLADTAGRLHTQTNLMQELKKVKKVMHKLDADAPHEVLLVIDATVGQNALEQAKYFNEAVGVTGLVITKLDGTAKGGIVFAIAKQLSIPIRFVGVGEGIDDLRPFSAEDYVNALLEK